MLNSVERAAVAGGIEPAHCFFVEGLPPDAVDVSEGLQSFSTRALALDQKAIYGPPSLATSR